MATIPQVTKLSGRAIRATPERSGQAATPSVLKKTLPTSPAASEPGVKPSIAARQRRAKILAFAEQIWGNRSEAEQWMKRENGQLSGNSPDALLESADGRERVEELLSALDNGFPV